MQCPLTGTEGSSKSSLSEGSHEDVARSLHRVCHRCSSGGSNRPNPMPASGLAHAARNPEPRRCVATGTRPRTNVMPGYVRRWRKVRLSTSRRQERKRAGPWSSSFMTPRSQPRGARPTARARRRGVERSRCGRSRRARRSRARQSLGSTWSRPKSGCSIASAWTGASMTARNSSARSPPGSASAISPAHT